MSVTKQLLISPPVPTKSSTNSLGLVGIEYGFTATRNRSAVPPYPGLAGVGQAILFAPQPPQSLIRIDSKFANRVSSDLDLASLLRVVEDSVKKFSATLDLEWEFGLSFPEDPELPQWDRIVLRIKPVDTPFEESMKLWDKIDFVIRDAIRKQAIGTANEKLIELQRRFFIELDLSD